MTPRWLLLGALAWVGLNVAAPESARAESAPAERAEAEAALRAITEQLNDLNVWLGGAERKRAQWQREIQASDREVAKLSREVDAAAEALAAVRRELASLTDEQARLEAQRAEQARHIADHLSSAYRLSGADFVKQILDQQSPDTFERMIRYHRYFATARLATVEEYQATLARLEENRARLEAREAEAERRREALRREQATLVAKRDERRGLLARLNREAESKSAERQRLVQDQERLESLLAELARRARTLDGRAFAARKGSLPWPLSGRVSNAFGQQRADGRLVWHGLVLQAEEGSPVTAVFRGRVVFADWLRGFGLLTIVDHGSGYMTLYGHADALVKRVGDWVESGEVIARAGRSGGQAESGLYFEVRHEGRAADPIIWLEKR